MEFENRKPELASFWEERFERGFTPWNQGAVPAALRDYVERHPTPQQVLIPGCGHAHELVYFLQQGWEAVAIDFAEAAVAQAKALLPSASQCIIQADFFEFPALPQLNVIYERAFFCALPPAMRTQIVRRWAELLPPEGRLIGFFFVDNDPDASKKGPPFRIHAQPLQDLMTPYFVCLENVAATDSVPVFQGHERWQVWQRRA